MPTATLYRGSYGLSNRVPPELIPFNAKTGVTGLQRADNVLIGEAGQLYCRQGSRQVFSESCRSPCKVPDGFLFIKESSNISTLTLAKHDDFGSLLYKDIGNLKYTGERAGWFERDGEYWFSTSRERGIVAQDYTLRAWPSNSPMMESSTELVYAGLPFSPYIDQHGPFTICGHGRDVYYSEPGQPSLYVQHENRVPLHGEVRLVASVEEGVFASDNRQIWFFSGRQPRQWRVKEALPYPAIPLCKLPGLVKLDDVGVDSYGTGVVFMTVKGPCVGLPDGSVINLTDKAFKMPTCNFSYGSMMLVNDSNLIISLY